MPLLALVAPVLLAAPPAEAVRLHRGDVAAAMRQEQGYDRTATTNLARFQARVLLRLVRQAQGRTGGAPLFIHHDDWFRAYLDALGLPEAAAPLPVRLSHAHASGISVEHRPERVIRRVVEGCDAPLATAVRWAPAGDRPPGRYSYDDTAARPRLRVTVSTVVTYRLLECDGLAVYDRVEGLWGRPTSGVLGALFRVIGEAKVAWSRFVVSADQWQVVRGKGAKGFLSRTVTVAVRPDGTVERDLPAGRPDLARLADRLARPVEVEYVP